MIELTFPSDSHGMVEAFIACLFLGCVVAFPIDTVGSRKQ